MASPLVACPAYRDTRATRATRATIDFLTTAFGFEARALYETDDGTIVHEELTLGDAMVMLPRPGQGPTGELMRSVPDAGKPTGGFYVVVDDADAHADRARAAGADIIVDPVTATTAAATTSAATRRGTCGHSAPTTLGTTLADDPSDTAVARAAVELSDSCRS